jgi:hypothetical protein
VVLYGPVYFGDGQRAQEEVELSQITTGGGVAGAAPEKVTRALLACGVVAGPLFMVVALLQAFTRPGFDLRRHALSMLSLGDLGWIQVTNFELTGLLAVALAIGIRRALRAGPAGTWGPPLIGAYGVGFIIAGIFPIDPALGFPPGAPTGFTGFSWHASLHFLGFTVAFIGLIAACLVFARRFARLRRRGWAAYSVATGVAGFALIALGMTGVVAASVAFAVMGLVTSAWIAVIALRLLSEQDEAQAAAA